MHLNDLNCLDVYLEDKESVKVTKGTYGKLEQRENNYSIISTYTFTIIFFKYKQFFCSFLHVGFTRGLSTQLPQGTLTKSQLNKTSVNDR